jgi:ferritin-like metal-binding protein YciE
MATKSQTKNRTGRSQSRTNSRVNPGGSKLQSQKTSTGNQQKTLEDLLEDGLKDIYSAEIQLIEALPEMAKAAYSEDLQDAINNHLNETKRQAERLEKIFTRLGIEKSDAKICEVMKGLIEESQKIIEEYEEGPVRDSALIIGAQKVEHYEIASYGSLCELCDVLGLNQIGSILGRTLDEEKNTDETLSEIAQDVNDDALEIYENEGQGQQNEFESVNR